MICLNLLSTILRGEEKRRKKKGSWDSPLGTGSHGISSFLPSRRGKKKKESVHDSREKPLVEKREKNSRSGLPTKTSSSLPERRKKGRGGRREVYPILRCKGGGGGWEFAAASLISSTLKGGEKRKGNGPEKISLLPLEEGREEGKMARCLKERSDEKERKRRPILYFFSPRERKINDLGEGGSGKRRRKGKGGMVRPLIPLLSFAEGGGKKREYSCAPRREKGSGRKGGRKSRRLDLHFPLHHRGGERKRGGGKREI